MTKKINTKSIRFIDKLKSIRKEIKFVFLISVLSILIIEIWFKKYDSPSPLIYFMGDMYLRVCYSIVAASIFFLINQHIPKENRNVKTNRYINNKLVKASNELVNLAKNLGLETNTLDFSEEMVSKACKKINPALPVMESDLIKFPNWLEYLKYKTDKINRLLNDVIILNSTIETELLGHIVNMLDALEMFDYLDNKNFVLGKDLNYYSYSISYLYEENKMIYKILRSGKYEIYTNTNMNEYKVKKLSKVKKM